MLSLKLINRESLVISLTLSFPHDLHQEGILGAVKDHLPTSKGKKKKQPPKAMHIKTQDQEAKAR